MLMTSMTTRRDDTEAHRKASEKITFVTELCGDLVNEHLANVPEDKRADVREALVDMTVDLRNLWRAGLSNEWKRDRRALLRFIASVFARWADAGFERAIVLHQLATNQKNKPKQITVHLNRKKIGI